MGPPGEFDCVCWDAGLRPFVFVLPLVGAVVFGRGIRVVSRGDPESFELLEEVLFRWDRECDCCAMGLPDSVDFRPLPTKGAGDV